MRLAPTNTSYIKAILRYNLILQLLTYLLIFLIPQSIAILHAQNQSTPQISGTFHFDLGLHFKSSSKLVLSPQEEEVYSAYKNHQLVPKIKQAQQIIKEEAKYIFHSMIYGFDLFYSPPDSQFQRKEVYTINPKHENLLSTRKLQTYHISNHGKQYYYSMRTLLTAEESRHIDSWQCADKKSLQGKGMASFHTAISQNTDLNHFDPNLFLKVREMSLHNAIKNAAITYFKSIIRNKPASISVHLALSDIPKLSIASGAIHSTVRLHLGEYTIFNYPNKS